MAGKPQVAQAGRLGLATKGVLFFLVSLQQEGKRWGGGEESLFTQRRKRLPAQTDQKPDDLSPRFPPFLEHLVSFAATSRL